MSTSFLSYEELCELTGLKYPAWQRRWLEGHNIRSLTRADGKLIVSRARVEAVLSGRPEATLKSTSPNFDALNDYAQTTKKRSPSAKKTVHHSR